MRRQLVLICFLASFLATVAFAASSTPEELLSAGRVDDAVKALKTRTSTSPTDAEAWHLLCRSYYAKARWDDAINAAKRAVALNPDSSDYHLWLGRSYGLKAESSGWFTALMLAGKVRTEFEKAVQLDVNNVGAQSDLAEFYTEAPGIVGGGKDKARRQAEQLSRRDAAAAHWIKGLLAEKDKDLKSAEQEYRAAVTASNGEGGRWLDMASFYYRTGRSDDMQHAIDQAIAADNKRSEVFYDAAYILYRSDRNLSDAAKLVRHYLSSDNKVEEAPAFQAHYLLGNILEKQGQKISALAEYRAALDLNSEFSDARNALKRLGQ
ncbi:MAG: tetratricopeptide repeat protein [Acidobacteriia bacterium]|nr:tetratricopeptide repeat protein [Terriglobia bacterium]